MIRFIDENLEKYFLAFTLGAISILVFIQVIMRYLLGTSLVWSEELIRWLFIWSIWIGVSYGFKQDKHMRITILTDRLSANAARVINVTTLAVCLMFFIVIAWYGYEQATSRLIMRQTSFALNNPITNNSLSVMWLYFSIPVGAGLSCIRITQSIVKTMKTRQAV